MFQIAAALLKFSFLIHLGPISISKVSQIFVMSVIMLSES